jgi:uncharacterized membrane protein YdbT with pleckstrin-like domain
MGYAESLLASGERIVMRDRQHWLAPLRHAGRAFILVLAGVLLFVLSRSVSGALNTALVYLAFVALIAGGLWLAAILLRWRSEAYLVTNRRVIKVSGLINKRSADSALEQINDAVLDQSLLGRILGYGDLGILTGTKVQADPKAPSGEVDRFTMLAHPKAFKIAMFNEKQELEFEGMRPQR